MNEYISYKLNHIEIINVKVLTEPREITKENFTLEIKIILKYKDVYYLNLIIIGNGIVEKNMFDYIIHEKKICFFFK
jgi:hypothetical protein